MHYVGSLLIEIVRCFPLTSEQLRDVSRLPKSLVQVLQRHPSHVSNNSVVRDSLTSYGMSAKNRQDPSRQQKMKMIVNMTSIFLLLKHSLQAVLKCSKGRSSSAVLVMVVDMTYF